MIYIKVTSNHQIEWENSSPQQIELSQRRWARSSAENEERSWSTSHGTNLHQQHRYHGLSNKGHNNR